MTVSRNAAFIKTYEDTAMVFRVFVKRLSFNELFDDFSRYETFLCEIAE